MVAELLRQIIPFLGGAIGALIFLVLIRETVRSLKKRRWRKKREHCLSLIGRVNDLRVEELLPLALELKKSFSLPHVESVLDQFRSQELTAPVRQKLAGIYDHLGLVERHLKTLKEAKSWLERAGAAEKLGQIGHVRAVLPLITLLRDASEDREVKSVATQALGEIRDERAITPLIEVLGLPGSATGQPVADVLAQFGELVLQPLMKVLSTSKREAQRFWAARILGGLKTQRATLTLLNTLSDHSPKVRAEAALALGRLGTHEGVSPLSRMLLEDPVPLVRDAAAQALGNIADDRALTALREGLADLDYDARRSATLALERMGERATPFFIEALRGESKAAAVEAASALERMGMVAVWIEDLAGEKSQPAFELLTCIAKTGVVETLARSLTHPKLSVRTRLCRILSEGASPRSFDTLTELAQKDSEWAARLEALVALIKLADARSVPLLSHALSEEEETVRERLLMALQDSPRSLLDPLADTVSALLQDANLKIRVQAIRVLAKMHTESLFSVLLSSFSDAAPEVRKEAALVLQHYSNKEGVQALIVALQDPDREVRAAAVKSLGQLKDPQAIGPLAHAFERADEGYRDDIVSALAAMPTQEFHQLTDLVMGLSHPKARAGIAFTLGLIGDQKAIGLLTIFLKDPEPMVRASAAGALGRFRRKEVAPVLVDWLSDPNQSVRAAVVDALGKSGNAAIMEYLLPMLETEPDTLVCQRVALAVGSLMADQGLETREQDLENRNLKLKATAAVKEWFNKRTGVKNQAAGLVALALLEDESYFPKILKASQDAPLRAAMQGFLKRLSNAVQDHFFAFLSLDPQLFWRDEVEKSVEHYTRLLQSSRETRDRVHAIEALSALTEKAALPALDSAFATDPSPQVRAAALAALDGLLEGEPLVARITQAAQDPSDIVRSQVIPTLNRLSPKELEGAREQLIPLLDSSQGEIRRPVEDLLARLYYHDWHVLADQLLGAEKRSRILGLIETLGKISHSQISPLLVQFMKHSDPEVRGASAQAAAQSGTLAKQEWIPCLGDSQETVRLAAIQGLGKQLDGEVLEIFAQHLQDPSSQIRGEMATLLGKKRLAGNERPTEILERLSQDVNLGVRIISLVSLLRLGVTGLAQEVAAAMPNLEAKERSTLLEHLRKEGLFVELLGTVQRGRHPEARKEALQFLSVLDLTKFTGEIANALSDPSSQVRVAAIEALGQLRDPLLEKQIEALSQDPVEEVRSAVKRRRLRAVQ
ncbi:HEAT repeat domain-containing protein [Acidobacteria bacterium AH-259-L09]|nr:HEAT repeat domain-containing protein [Acidobacteria bacterium AH-259-L09]